MRTAGSEPGLAVARSRRAARRLRLAQPGVDRCRAGLGVKASDGDLQVGSLMRPLEVGDVCLDLLQAEPSLLVGEVLVDGPRVDVVDGDLLSAARPWFAPAAPRAGPPPASQFRTEAAFTDAARPAFALLL